MNLKIWIASALALASFLSASAPSPASAGTPLLSGYGGPGAGEQAIIGSTLLARPRGGGSSGGSPSSADSSGSTAGGSGGSPTSGSGSGASRTGGSSAGASASRRAAGEARGSSDAGRSRDTGLGAVGYIYPRSPSPYSGDSHVIGISGGDVLPLAGIVLALMLVGVFTVRFVRLQP